MKILAPAALFGALIAGAVFVEGGAPFAHYGVLALVLAVVGFGALVRSKLL